VFVEFRAEEVAGSSGVREQVMDRDFGGELFVGVIAEVLPERVAELYLAHLRKLKYGDGGEHLVHRADANLRVELIGDLLLAVRQTVGAGEDGLAAFDDEHSTCKFILRGAFVEFVPKRRKRAILGEARHRELSGSGNEPKVELRPPARNEQTNPNRAL